MTEEDKKPFYKKWWGILLIVVGLIIVVGVAANNDDSTTDVIPVAQEAEPAEKVTETKQHFTNDNFANVLSNANKYKGSTVDITGQIFLPPKKDGGALQFQINTDPANNEGNTIVLAATSIDLKDGDFVRVKGTVNKTLEYENLMGGETEAPLIDAESVEKVAAQDVLAPTENSIDVNQTQDQHGVVVTLQKVEFAENETRLYLHVKNNTDQSANIHTFNMKVTQGSKQYDEESSYGSGYPEIQSDLLPGIETEGVVVFPKLDYAAKEFSLYVEASSDNYNLDFNPYTFLVQWQ